MGQCTRPPNNEYTDLTLPHIAKKSKPVEFKTERLIPVKPVKQKQARPVKQKQAVKTPVKEAENALLTNTLKVGLRLSGRFLEGLGKTFKEARELMQKSTHVEPPMNHANPRKQSIQKPSSRELEPIEMPLPDLASLHRGKDLDRIPVAELDEVLRKVADSRVRQREL